MDKGIEIELGPWDFFSFEDWKGKNYSVPDLSETKCGCDPSNRKCGKETPFCVVEKMKHEEDGLYHVHCLPEIERLKIEAEQRQTLKALIDAFFNPLKTAFDVVFQRSLEKESLIEGHLKNLDTLFRARVFETVQAQQVASMDITELWVMAGHPLPNFFLDKDFTTFRIAQNRGEAMKNGFYRYHQDLTIKGETADYWKYIRADSLEREKKGPEMATIFLVLYRFQEYLKSLQATEIGEGNEADITSSVGQIDRLLILAILEKFDVFKKIGGSATKRASLFSEVLNVGEEHLRKSTMGNSQPHLTSKSLKRLVLLFRNHGFEAIAKGFEIDVATAEALEKRREKK